MYTSLTYVYICTYTYNVLMYLPRCRPQQFACGITKPRFELAPSTL